MPESDRRLPYPGLRPFEAADADLFFGRERQVDGLLQRLSGSHFVAVVGESGAGKSSLVRAGLLPTLEAGFVIEAGSDWRVALMRPGASPLEALTNALLAPGVLSDEGGSPRREFALAELRRGPLGLAQLIGDAHLPPSCNVLLVVDQFEELFRYCREPAQKDQANIFVELLLRATEQRRVSISVVLTMRSDFVGDCARFRGLPERLNDNQFLTPRLTREQVADAIKGPARVCGGIVDPALVDELCNAVGDNQDQLPLLQHLLMRVWERASQESGPPRLTPELAAEIGGLYSALSRHAQEIYDSLEEPQQAIARAMFRSLTDPFSQRRDLRRDAGVAEIAAVAGAQPEEVMAVANEFRANGRHMLMPPAAVPLSDSVSLDISHESLIRQWSTLNGWAAEESNNAREFQRLQEEASRDPKDRELLAGRNLARALDWIKQARPTPAWAERYAPAGSLAPTLSFIEESENKESERRAEEIRRLQRAASAKRERIYNRVIATLGILVIVVVGLAAYRSWSESKQFRELFLVANSRQLAMQADLTEDPEIAILLANQAVTQSPDEDQSVQALRNALARYVPNMEVGVGIAKRKNYVPGTDKNSFLFSGLTLASTSPTLNEALAPFENRTTIFSLDTGKALGILDVAKNRSTGQSGIIGSAIFSPDGKLVVTAGSESGGERGVVLVWDRATEQIVKDLSEEHTGPVNGAAFSPSGDWLVTLSDDETAKVFAVPSLVKRCELHLPGRQFVSASFSPDEKELLTLVHEFGWQSYLWNVSTCSDALKNSRVSELLTSAVAANFSPNGEYLGLVAGNGTVKFLHRMATGWNEEKDLTLASEDEHAALGDSEEPPLGIVWDNQSKYFAVAGVDHVLRVRKLEAFDAEVLEGHTGPITSMSFHPTQPMVLLTSSEDRTARLWRVPTKESGLLAPESIVLQGHADSVHSAIFSRDGNAVFTAGDDGTVRLWKPEFPFQELSDIKADILAAFFSMDGKRIAIVHGATVSTVDLDTGKVSAPSPWGSLGELYADGAPGDFQYFEEFSKSLGDTIRERDLALGGTFDSPTITRMSANGVLILNDVKKKGDTDSVWIANQLGERKEMARPMSSYRAMGVSNDGAVVWYSPDEDSVLIAREEGKGPRYSIKGEKTVEVVRFSGDGQKVAVTFDDNSIQIIDVNSGEGLVSMVGHSDYITNVAFSSNDRYLASVSDDASLRIWNVATGTEIAGTELFHLGDSIHSASFSPDGHSLLLMGSYGLYLWRCDACGETQQLLETVQRYKQENRFRTLTPEEETHYGIAPRMNP